MPKTRFNTMAAGLCSVTNRYKIDIWSPGQSSSHSEPCCWWKFGAFSKEYHNQFHQTKWSSLSLSCRQWLQQTNGIKWAHFYPL